MNKTVKTLLSLLGVAGVSAGILFAADLLTRSLVEQQNTDAVNELFGEFFVAARYEQLETGEAENVTAAYAALDKENALLGYGVTVSVQGYAGTIEVHAAVSSDGSKVEGVRIGTHNETAGYGARITSTVFLDQFSEAATPIYLAQSRIKNSDGVYRATATEAEFGFFDTVEITVKEGEITAVSWDAHNSEGQSKKDLSKAGNYVMSEGSLPWHEQAKIMEQALLYTQDPKKLTYDPESGKTDAYSGATVRVSAFIKLATQALEQAGDATTAGGTAIDGLSGATTSSKAVIAAVNTAVQFVQSQRRS